MRERLQQRFARTHRLGLLDHAADRVLRGALRDHHHRHMRIAQRREHALSRAGHADQAGAFQIDHGQVRAQGQALDRAGRGALGGDARARMIRMEGVADDDRQAALDRRRHRLRVHHLGAEIGQFAGFVVAQRFQLDGLGHHPRVSGEHAIHVRPDMQLIGIEQGGKDRAGVIAAVAAQCGDAVLAVAGNKAGRHDARLRMLQPPLGQAFGAAHPVHVHAQFAAFDHQHIARIQHGAVFAQRPQVLAEQLGGIHLAHALHAVQHLSGQAADHRQRAQHLGQLVEALVQPLHRRASVLTQQGNGGTAMAGPQRMPVLAPGAAVFGGQRRHADQCIGDALHRRDHGDLHRLLARQQQLCHMAIALGIGHRGAAELVDHGGHTGPRGDRDGRRGGRGSGSGDRRHADLDGRPRVTSGLRVSPAT